MRTLTLTCIGLTFASCNVVPRVDVTPAYGSFSVDGKVGAASGGGSATTQTLSAIGIDGSEGAFTGQATVDWLNFQVALSGFQTDYSGSGTTTAGFSYGGQTIGTGVGVNSALDINYLSGAFTFDVFPGDTVDIGLGLGLAALDLKLDVTETGGSNSVSVDEKVPIPELVVRGAVDLGRFGVVGNLGWISGKYDNFDGKLLDFDLQGRVRILGSGSRIAGHAALGYRYLETNFEYDDGGDQVKADLQIDGPYLGVTFSF